MHPIEHIRKNVFKVSQSVMAEITGVTQATVSRWEAAELDPGREEMGRIRDAARERGLAWDDRWFFDSPSISPDQQPERAGASK